MPHLEFRYSSIYDEMFTKLDGKNFTSSEEKAGYKFERQLTNIWKKYDAKLFKFYRVNKIAYPDHWIIYIVHQRFELDPFSDPTTIVIEKDMDDILATVVHEFGHLLLKQPANERRMAGIWRHLQKEFKNEHWRVIVHIPVALLARASLRHMLGQEKAEKILLPERRFYGLKKSWSIIDKQGDLDWDRPLKAMMHLHQYK